MNERVLNDIMGRLDRLERTAVRYRGGEVTGTDPLDVALGGSGTSFEAVKALSLVASGDSVSALTWGNDMLVLGEPWDGTIHYIGSGDGVAPSFTNSWVNLDNSAATPGGGANRDAGFYKANGRVYLTGAIKTGSSGTSAFTLPAGFRPKAGVVYTVGASGDAAFVTVASTGTVVPSNIGAAAVATFVFLDGVDFIAA